MDLLFEDKTILVTGASKGLGFACAARLAAEGAQVILVSRSTENLKRAVDEIVRRKSKTPDIFVCDVAQLSELLRLQEYINGKYRQLDGMVLNAGGPPPGNALDLPEDVWASAIETNLLSVVRLCKLFVPKMVSQNFGRIVAITSTSAKQPIDNLVLSNTTRLGVIGYLKTLSNETSGRNILTNVLMPGPTKTQRLQSLNQSRAERLQISVEEVEKKWIAGIPRGKLGDPQDLANLATFLLSEINTYITGQVIAVDGGYVKSAF